MHPRFRRSLVARTAGLLLLLCFSPVVRAASPPERVTLQGRLTNASGVPVNASADIVVRCYDALVAGNEILVDSHTAAGGNAVPVTNGLYELQLGGGTVADGTGPGSYTTLGAVFRDYQTVYIGIRVAPDAADMTPRSQIISSAYALNALNLDGYASSAYIRLSPGAAGRIIYDTGAAWAALGAGSNGQALISAGAAAPAWGSLGPTYGGTGQNSSGWSGVPTVSAGTWSINSSLPVARGGTNSTAALNNNRILVSNAGAIVEFGALTNGQLLIGSTGAMPAAATISGTANQVSVSNGAGTITLAYDYTATLAGNPGLAANGTVFGSTGPLFEGSTADTFEGLLTTANPTADRTWTLPNNSGTVALTTDIPAGGTPALTFSTANGAGSASTYIRTDATLALFDATNPTALGTASPGSAGLAARRDHVHPAINLSSGGGTTFTGTLPATYGGTGLNTSASAGIPSISGGTWSVTSSGTAGYFPRWSSSTTLGDSRMSQDADRVWITSMAGQVCAFNVYPPTALCTSGIFGTTQGGSAADGTGWGYWASGGNGVMGALENPGSYRAGVLGTFWPNASAPIAGVLGCSDNIDAANVYGGLCYFDGSSYYAGYFSGNVYATNKLGISTDPTWREYKLQCESPSVPPGSDMGAAYIYALHDPQPDNAADRNGLKVLKARSGPNDAVDYTAWGTNCAIKGFNSWGDRYNFGVHGAQWDDFERCGGVLGSQVFGEYWGALGYKDSGSNKYGAYWTSWGGGIGALPDGDRDSGDCFAEPEAPSRKSEGIGFGSYGGLFGGWIRGDVYGIYATGDRFSRYTCGNSFDTGYQATLHTTRTGPLQRVPLFNVASQDVDVFAHGVGRIRNGEGRIEFDPSFRNSVSSDVPVVLTVTPMGRCKQLCIMSVSNEAATIAETDGASDVDFAWIAIGRRAGFESRPQVPEELLDPGFDAKMKGVTFDENDRRHRSTYVWYDEGGLHFRGSQPDPTSLGRDDAWDRPALCAGDLMRKDGVRGIIPYTTIIPRR